MSTVNEANQNDYDVNVDPFSLCVLKLTMMRDDLELAVGSGVLWKHQNRLAIVTAWHNLTGVHFQTRKSLSNTGARPNKLKAAFLTNEGNKFRELHVSIRSEKMNAIGSFTSMDPTKLTSLLF